MYLMSLTNLDYIWITLVFGCIGGIAYLFRRKNSTTELFLFAKTKVSVFLQMLGMWGILEFVIAGNLGAKFGVTAIYYALIGAGIAILVANLKLQKNLLSTRVHSFSEYLSLTTDKYSATTISVILILLWAMLTSLTMIITFKLLQALFGWSFVNSVVAILGLTLVYVLLGGAAAVCYNQLIQKLFILLVLSMVIVLAVISLGGISATTHNLQALAHAQFLIPNYYTHIQLHKGWPLTLAASIIAIAGIYSLSFIQNDVSDAEGVIHNTKAKTMGKVLAKLIIQLAIVVILIIPGILAIATKPTTATIQGKQIVTLQAQLPNGQTGYVVKTIDARGNDVTATPGIIPPLVDDVTGIVETNKYDFDLASVVTVKHYLPHVTQLVSLIIILFAFMLATARYTTLGAQALICGILRPWRVFHEYGDIGLLWASRMGIIGLSAMGVIGSYFLLSNFDLIYLSAVVVGVLVAPLFAMVILALFLPKVSNLTISVLFGVLLGVALITYYQANLILNLALITTLTFSLTLISGILIYLAKKKQL